MWLRNAKKKKRTTLRKRMKPQFGENGSHELEDIMGKMQRDFDRKFQKKPDEAQRKDNENASDNNDKR